jgi:hypothetical protein
VQDVRRFTIKTQPWAAWTGYDFPHNGGCRWNSAVRHRMHPWKDRESCRPQNPELVKARRKNVCPIYYVDEVVPVKLLPDFLTLIVPLLRFCSLVLLILSGLLTNDSIQWNGLWTDLTPKVNHDKRVFSRESLKAAFEVHGSGNQRQEE